MLSRKENVLNIYCLQMLSKMHLIPLHVDPKNFLIQPKADRKSLVLNSFLPTLVQCHALFALCRFLSSLKTQGMSAIATATVDYTVIMFAELGLYALFESFIRSPDVTKLLSQNLVLEEAQCRSSSRKGALWGYSLTEVCTMIFPAVLSPVVASVSFMYGALYLWTETSDWNFSTCVISCIAEFAVNFSWMSFCYCIGLLQIVFLQKISHDLQVQMEYVR